MEHIDVTFGGRSVRLKQQSGLLWKHETLVLTRDRWNDCFWRAAFSECGHHYGAGDSPQSAVAAVESKLRDLRDQLTSMLGE